MDFPRDYSDIETDFPDPSVRDDEESEMAPDRRSSLGFVGQLVQRGDEDVDAVDDESNVLALDEGFDGEQELSAEEAAMHAIDE